jgi:ubiquinone/menaquinone biosynthesis C-methylase UbiE
MNDNFKAKAAQWDSPDKIKMTQKFISEMLLHVNPQSNWKVLELGAGTGLIGLQILPLVAKVVFEDTSESMLNVLKQKLTGKENIDILHGEVFDYQKQDIDLVFSSMAFHHIENIEKTIQHLSTITKTGGLVVIADLVTEDGSFHSFEPIPHRGFDTTVLSEEFQKAGFEVKSVYIYSKVSKAIDYEQFILIAQRK